MPDVSNLQSSGPSLQYDPSAQMFAMGESQKQIDQDTLIKQENAIYGENGRSIHNSKLSSQDKISQLEPVTDSSAFKKELMKVTIDLGGGAQETILVREGETPNMVAKAFAEKFDLSTETEQLLQEQILYNLNQLQLNNTGSAAEQDIPAQRRHKPNESDGEVDDAESDEERAKVANINSMDPLQWSMHRQGITKNVESRQDKFEM